MKFSYPKVNKSHVGGIAAALIGVLILLFIIFPKITAFMKMVVSLDWLGDANEIKKQKEEKLEAVKVDNSKLTFSVPYAGILADRLYEAMDGIGTDEDAILQVFTEIATPDDMKAVYKAFGIRDYLWFSAAHYVGSPYTLDMWLDAELNSNYYNQIKPKLKWI